MGTTAITIQISTTVDGVNITIPANTSTITHAAEGHVQGTFATRDVADIIPQGFVTTPYFIYVRNMSEVATEFIDILANTSVLTRLNPGMQAVLDVSQIAYPLNDLKARANTGKTPVLQYFIVGA